MHASFYWSLTLQVLLGPLREQGKLDEAVTVIRQALAIRPTYADAHNNLGVAMSVRGEPQAALASYEEALRLRPDLPDARWNRSLTWLLMGDLEKGWPEYEWRWKRQGCKSRPFTQPLWDGSPLNERTILIHAEQGLGDTLQFVRYAPLVKKCGGTVICECQRALAPLLAGFPGIDQLVPAGKKLPDFDVHSPLVSIPRILGTRMDTIPAEVPYLARDPSLVDHWKQELCGIRKFKIGIAWQGSPKFKADRWRSVPLKFFAPLARLVGVRLISLQKGPGTDQLAQVADQFEVFDLSPRLDETAGPFMDTVAVMKNLDLVITSDTAIPHLAGALGVPVWVALSFAPDWRFFLGREDSPWYPTVRLFRQSRLCEWAEVFERMADELKQMLGTTSRAGPINVQIAPGELIDKITILEIKCKRISDPAKLENVRAELAKLRAARTHAVDSSEELDRLTAELKAVNLALWEIEDAIRDCERAKDFGPRFTELARSVYHNNDRRAVIKRKINELLGSKLIEEKSHQTY